MGEKITTVEGLALCLLAHIAGQLTIISTRMDVSEELAQQIQGQFSVMAEAVRELVANG